MAIDQAHRQNVSSLFLPVIESVNPCLILVVRRENIVGDAMEVLRKTKNIDYKKPLKVLWRFLLYNLDFYLKNICVFHFLVYLWKLTKLYFKKFKTIAKPLFIMNNMLYILQGIPLFLYIQYMHYAVSGYICWRRCCRCRRSTQRIFLAHHEGIIGS